MIRIIKADGEEKQFLQTLILRKQRGLFRLRFLCTGMI